MSETEDQIFAIAELPQRMNAVLPETVQNMKRHNVIARIMPSITLALARSQAEAYREAADMVDQISDDIGTMAEGANEPPFSMLIELEATLMRLAKAIREKGER